MKALLLVVVKVCPLGDHAIAQDFIERQELLGIVNPTLTMPLKKTIEFPKTCLALKIRPEISTEAIRCVRARYFGTTIATMALLWSHIHIDETQRKT
jgi:hypothetical protein